MIERPRWDLTIFKVHFGLLTLKGYTKGEHVLRFEAIVHNTRALHCGRVLEKFGEIVTRLAAMVDRFTTMLDCVDIGFLPDRTLDELPPSSQVGATRVGGVDVNKPRIRGALAAVLALAVAPQGFTVAEFTAKVQALTGQEYSIRQGAYDLRKLRGKQLVAKPAEPAATTSRKMRPVPSPRCSRSATRSSHRCWLASAPHDEDVHQPAGPVSTTTTRPCAAGCRPCSTTWASPPRRPLPHRQQIVDRLSSSG